MGITLMALNDWGMGLGATRYWSFMVNECVRLLQTPPGTTHGSMMMSDPGKRVIAFTTNAGHRGTPAGLNLYSLLYIISTCNQSERLKGFAALEETKMLFGGYVICLMGLCRRWVSRDIDYY